MDNQERQTEMDKLAEALDIIQRKREEMAAAGMLLEQRQPAATVEYRRRMGITNDSTATTLVPQGAGRQALALPPYLLRQMAEAEARREEQLAVFRLAGGKCEQCFDTGMAGRDACDCERGLVVYEEQVAAIEAERAERKAAAAAAAWRMVGVPARWQGFSFDSSPVQRDSDVWRGVQAWLGNADAGLVLTGPRGTGKTGLVVAALRARHLAGWDCRYMLVPDLLDAIKRTYDSGGSEADVLEPLRKARLIALDDIGLERRTDWSAGQLTNLIAYRHAQGLPTIITSNYDLDGLASRFGELGGRIVDRIFEQSGGHVYTTEGLTNLREMGVE